MSNELEEWKTLESGGITYEISSLGRVRRYLNPYKSVNSKYLQVFIAGRGPVFLHGLVAELFIGNKPVGLVTNHKDGDGTNPRLENLEYITHQENMLHAVRSGLRKPYGVGQNSTRWKVGDADAQNILDSYKKGAITYRELAHSYGVSSKCIEYIVRHRKGLNRGK